MALSQGEGAREYYAEGRAAAEISRLWARDRAFDQGDPRNGVGLWRHAQAGGVTTPLSFSGLIIGMLKTRVAPRVFLLCPKVSPRHCERSEAIQSFPARRDGLLRRCAPLHKRFAFVAGNDEEGRTRLTPPSARRIRRPVTASGSPTRCRRPTRCPRWKSPAEESGCCFRSARRAPAFPVALAHLDTRPALRSLLRFR